jgi:hypothetical protein
MLLLLTPDYSPSSLVFLLSRPRRRGLHRQPHVPAAPGRRLQGGSGRQPGQLLGGVLEARQGARRVRPPDTVSALSPRQRYCCLTQATRVHTACQWGFASSWDTVYVKELGLKRQSMMRRIARHVIGRRLTRVDDAMGSVRGRLYRRARGGGEPVVPQLRHP